MAESLNVEQIIKDLTLDEKVRLLAGSSTWTTAAIERLNVPAITVRMTMCTVSPCIERRGACTTIRGILLTSYRPYRYLMGHMACEERPSSMG